MGLEADEMGKCSTPWRWSLPSTAVLTSWTPSVNRHHEGGLRRTEYRVQSADGLEMLPVDDTLVQDQEHSKTIVVVVAGKKLRDAVNVRARKDSASRKREGALPSTTTLADCCRFCRIYGARNSNRGQFFPFTKHLVTLPKGSRFQA